jgi:acyl-CoA dehydrogenase
MALQTRLLRTSLPRRAAASLTSTRAFSASSIRREELMDMTILSESQREVREGVKAVCANFPDAYWRERDVSHEFPFEFHKAIADGGWLGVALPERFGGSGLGLAEAAVMMQTITESGAGFPGAQSTHGNVYATQPLGIFGTDEQRSELIPKIVGGEYRTCFGVTEPNVGLNTLELKTTATRREDGSWAINGQKTWITCAQNAQVMMLLARTKPLEECVKKSEGLTLFAIPVDKNQKGIEMRAIKKMGGNAVDSNEIWFDNYIVPSGSVIGGDANIGKGFKIVLHGMNSERVLIGAEALGLGYAAVSYS